MLFVMKSNNSALYGCFWYELLKIIIDSISDGIECFPKYPNKYFLFSKLSLQLEPPVNRIDCMSIWRVKLTWVKWKCVLYWNEISDSNLFQNKNLLDGKTFYQMNVIHWLERYVQWVHSFRKWLLLVRKSLNESDFHTHVRVKLILFYRLRVFI